MKKRELILINWIKNLFHHQLIRFLFVGGLNTIFGYSIFAFFIYIGFHYSLAVLFSTILGILFNFKTIGKLVFKNHDNKLILKFFLVYTITYILNVGGLKIFNLFAVNNYISGAILILPMALISFFLNKKFVFK